MEKKESSALAARILLIPAVIGFALLFGANFALIALAVAMTSAGALTAPIGVLYLLGMVKVVSDLSPFALICAGLFCLFFGIFSGFSVTKLAPFSYRLLTHYIAAVKGEKWRRIYYKAKKKPFMALSLALALFALALTAVAQRASVKDGGFRSTVVKESLTFPAAKYINISTTGLNLKLKPYDGEEIKVEYVNDSAVLIPQSDINYLKLVQDDKFTLSLFAVSQFDYNMTVWLPVNDYREIYLDSGSGDITIFGTQSEYTDIRTRSGNITLNGVDQTVSASAIEGNISCFYSAFNSAGTFETKSGNIIITLPEKAGVNLQYRTESGKLQSGIWDMPSDNYGSIDLEYSEGADKPNYLYVTTGSGSLRLERNADS